MSSEALAFSLVTEINHAMARLVDIWDSIGIMEEQRVERMQTVKKHIDVSNALVCMHHISHQFLIDSYSKLNMFYRSFCIQ